MDAKKCRCGCNDDAAFKFSGHEFDPKAKDKKGKAFVEYACHSATRYMVESSAELGFQYTVEKLPCSAPSASSRNQGGARKPSRR